uniref:protein disulfide-isomerase n=1 Tax=Neogobius melanostomus TaxID=47308 RepID=A0A8C6UKX0_9GOBI
MAEVKASLVSAVVAAFLSSAVLAFVEDLDDSFKDSRVNDIWLVDFYAPWCGYCKKLEPVWEDVGLELKSSGSPVRVGKMDATAFSGMASEFGVRGYPTIKLLKGDLAYSYKGPRTKDDIVEFANRVSGPAMRALPSKQMFEHMLKRHTVLFVYVGGESPLREKYSDVASELIVHTYFFSASEEVFPEEMTLPELPAVVVFKDGGYFTYDGELFFFSLFAIWTVVFTSKLKSLILPLSCSSLGPFEGGFFAGVEIIGAIIWRIKVNCGEATLLGFCKKTISQLYFSSCRDFQFGHMDGNDYINSLIMGEVPVPSVIILNTSNEQYFLPEEPVQTLEQLVQFINNVHNGSAQAYGGDGIIQRIKRIGFDARATIMSVFRSSPLLGCFLFGLPLGVISLMCYGICTAETDDAASEDMDALKREEEEEDDVQPGQDDSNEKDPQEKKTD